MDLEDKILKFSLATDLKDDIRDDEADTLVGRLLCAQFCHGNAVYGFLLQRLRDRGRARPPERWSEPR